MKKAIGMICVALSLTACGSMDTRDRNTVIGAGLGAAAGAAVTDGSVAGTMCRTSTRVDRAPSARAACTYSSSLSFNT